MSTPSNEALKAANEIADKVELLLWRVISRTAKDEQYPQYWMSTIIDAHMLHEGKTAKEWFELWNMCLAAVMTASLQNTESTIKDRIPQDNPYWTPAYADVCTAVDREMRERKRAEAAEARVKELEDEYAEIVDALQCGTLPPAEHARHLHKCIAELESYKQRMELAVGVSETSISDELIRRKQAEALRWAGMQQGIVFNQEIILNNLAAAIERGEVNIENGRGQLPPAKQQETQNGH